MAVLALALPKTLKSREKDKVVFREIGEVIAQREGNGEEIKIAAPTDILRWISFYANLDYPGAPCPQPYEKFSPLVGDGYKTCLMKSQGNGDTLSCMDGKEMAGRQRPVPEESEGGKFAGNRSWNHPDTGRIILLKLP